MDLPDLVGIVRDGPVGRKAARVANIEPRLLGPGKLVCLVFGSHAVTGFAVVGEVT